MAMFSPVMADDVTFTASAPKQVIQGRQFQVVFTLQNASGNKFMPPDFPGFSVLFGPATSQSNQVSIVNGKMSRISEYAYTYTLRADKEGIYTIAAATIEVGGKQLSSNTLNIQVLPPDPNTPAPAGGNSGAGSRAQQASGEEEPELFARLILSKTSVYEQEPILATIKFYTRGGNILGIQDATLPSFDGFVSQEIDRGETQIEWEHYNGKNYQVVVVKQMLLYPQHSGELKISQGSFDVSILVERAMPGIFRMMRGTQELIRTATTEPVTVRVKPLPSPQPASFMNAVGSRLKLTSLLSKESLTANEAVTLKLVLEGTANLKYMKNPEVKFPVDFDVYDPKVSTDLKNTPSGVSGTRTVEYTIIPRSAGEFTLPPVEFTYFDINAKQYKTLQTPEYHLTVARGAGNDNSVVLANFSDKEAVKQLNQDIRFIRLGDLQQEKELSFFYGSWAYRLCYIVPVLLLVAFLLINYRQTRERANVARLRTKKANKVAIRRLKVAGKYLKERNNEQFYDETLKALWGYISDKLQLPLSELSRDNIAAKLRAYGADDPLIARVMEVMNTCEFARYAPSQNDEAMDRLYEETLDVIGKMENIKR